MAAALTFCPLGASSAQAAGPLLASAPNVAKLSPDLAASLAAAGLRSTSERRVLSPTVALPRSTRFRVIVRFKPASARAMSLRADSVSLARTTLSGARSLKNRVQRVRDTFTRLGVAAADVTADQLAELTNDPRIAGISLDLPVTASGDPILDVNPQAVGADQVWSPSGPQHGNGREAIGAGIGVAVVDSGIAPVPDLAGQIIAFKDMINSRTAPYDDFGHGTHVAGIIGGSGAASSGPRALRTYRGIAPGVNLIGVKVLDQDGGGDVSSVLAGIEWVIANKDAYNIRVMNLSLGHPIAESYATDPLCQAVERAVNAGIVVVCSAGNRGTGGYGSVGSPGNNPAVITVGASNSQQSVARDDDAITSYSSRGPTRFDLSIKPDLVAPGNRIVSLRAPGATIDTLYPETRVAPSSYLKSPAANAASQYTTLSGTSMAAPSVAGAAVLALQIKPGLQPNGVKAALMYSAQLLRGVDPLSPSEPSAVYDPLTQGAGELNVVGMAEMVSLMQPGSGLSACPTGISMIGGLTFPWTGPTVAADNLVWGGRQLWGDNLVWGGRQLWGDNLVWGGRQLWGDNLVWGGRLVTADNLVWGGRLVWGDNLVWGGRQLQAENLVWGGRIVDGENLVWGGRQLWGDNLVWGGRQVGGDTMVWGSHLVEPDPDSTF
jgi:serine protease AprX